MIYKAFIIAMAAIVIAACNGTMEEPQDRIHRAMHEYNEEAEARLLLARTLRQRYRESSIWPTAIKQVSSSAALGTIQYTSADGVRRSKSVTTKDFSIELKEESKAGAQYQVGYRRGPLRVLVVDLREVP